MKPKINPDRTEIHIGTAYFHIGVEGSLREGCSVYLIEPHPGHFDKLKNIFSKKNINKKNLHLLNFAISDETSSKDFYIFNSEKAKEYDIDPHIWMEGTCGFDPVKSSDPRICGQQWLDVGLKMYNKIKVPSMSFIDFINKYKIKNVDFIKIDTEGYDLDIIAQINFNLLQVKKIQFEYFIAKHRNPYLFESTINHLNNLGFEITSQNRQDLILERP